MTPPHPSAYDWSRSSPLPRDVNAPLDVSRVDLFEQGLDLNIPLLTYHVYSFEGLDVSIVVLLQPCCYTRVFTYGFFAGGSPMPGASGSSSGSACFKQIQTI